MILTPRGVRSRNTLLIFIIQDFIHDPHHAIKVFSVTSEGSLADNPIVLILHADLLNQMFAVQGYTLKYTRVTRSEKCWPGRFPMAMLLRRL